MKITYVVATGIEPVTLTVSKERPQGFCFGSEAL
jgi:hypothetical protein